MSGFIDNKKHRFCPFEREREISWAEYVVFASDTQRFVRFLAIARNDKLDIFTFLNTRIVVIFNLKRNTYNLQPNLKMQNYQKHGKTQ
jgi:hypothetical protein